MNLRDEIKAEFSLYMHDQQAEESADAIIAKLRPAPLVWKRSDLSAWGDYSGPYRMTWDFGKGPNGEDTFFIMMVDGAVIYSGWGDGDEEAKAAAEAHHIAAWRKAGGLDT